MAELKHCTKHLAETLVIYSTDNCPLCWAMKELSHYRKLEAAAYEAVTPEEKRVVLMGIQPN